MEAILPLIPMGFHPGAIVDLGKKMGEFMHKCP